MNAYTLTFAVLLLTGAALGDRSAAGGCSPRPRLVHRRVGGRGPGARHRRPGRRPGRAGRRRRHRHAADPHAAVSAASRRERRGLALGAWGAVGGLAIALGPLVGGAVVEGASWQWIFWLNVPIGIALLPLARLAPHREPRPRDRLDLPRPVLASVGLFGIVLGVVRGNDARLDQPTCCRARRRRPAGRRVHRLGTAGTEPMLPMHLFRSRGFTVTNAASLLMFFGMFGSIFLLAQFLQIVQHYSPLGSGLRTLPWTAPCSSRRSRARCPPHRTGGRCWAPASPAGHRARLARHGHHTVTYPASRPFILAGVGMALFFAPSPTSCLSGAAHQEGQASGANNAISELGGVFGVAVLAAVFAGRGGYPSGNAFVVGMNPHAHRRHRRCRRRSRRIRHPKRRTATPVEAAGTEETLEPITA